VPAVPVEAPSALPPGPVLADNDDAPWHDPAMALAERMTLAEKRPYAPRLMAAMAQQDCGQCGYTCAAYANAIASGAEGRLNLCAPGGKDTLRMVQKLVEAEAGTGAAPAAPAIATTPKPEPARGYDRDAPVAARFLSRRRLNRADSGKDTWHVEFDLSESGVAYEAGDSLGIRATNATALVDSVIGRLGARPEGLVADKPLRQVLLEDVSLGAAPDALFQLFSYVSGGAARAKARALASGEDPDGDAATLDVLAALTKFEGTRPCAEAFVEALDPLQPRLYSISSSPKHAPGRVTLTVDAVRYDVNRRRRVGVASTFLADRVGEGAAVPVHVQKAHGFALPAPETPLIMIGPGTGIAPFRAFLQEREAVKAPGRNWLFFGHQRRDTDFFYKDELTAWKASGLLTRLSLAWSRDGAEKVYVQDRMREVGADLWAWLAEGAHVRVCGDAKRMAKDVERALVDVAATHGAKSSEEAIAFVAGLKKAGRWQADVY
jgi:sulfite reductase (NADPH) flavoprotein alpha-component